MFGIFLDIETNGLSPFKHRPIELAFKIVEMKTGRLIDSFQTIITTTAQQWQLSDPTSLKINGFNFEKSQQGISCEEASNKVQACFELHKIKRGDAVFICQNPSFDRAFFAQIVDPELQEKKSWPYHWLDLASMFWAISLFQKGNSSSPYPWEVGCSKDKIAKSLKIESEAMPHQAMNGVDHLILCYEAIVGFPG